MSGELVPDPQVRLSDADRERFVERLHQAVGEGRLTLAEFEDRVDKVLAAQTYQAVRPYVADLPGAPEPARDVVELRARSSSLKRKGQWRVPRRLVVTTQSSSVKLDFTETVIPGPGVEVVMDTRSSSLTLVLPRGATTDTEDLEMVSSSARDRVGAGPGTGPHFRVYGRVKSSSLTLRYRRHFLFWTW